MWLPGISPTIPMYLVFYRAVDMLPGDDPQRPTRSKYRGRLCPLSPLAGGRIRGRSRR